MEAALGIKEEIKAGVYLLHLTGDLTRTSGNELLQWHKWEEGLPEKCLFLLLNFTAVDYINSAGIAALIRLVRIGAGGLYHCGSYGVNYHYEKLFYMVGLTNYLSIYPSEWAALERIKGKSDSDSDSDSD